MARGTTLANALLMLKGELGYALTANVATAQDQELYTLIDNKQKWLSSEYDWPFLKQRVDIAVTAGVSDSTRYQTVPTTINFERPVLVEVLWTTRWHEVDQGIGGMEFSAIPSGDGSVTAMQVDPIRRWDWKAGDPSKFEIWPLPSTAQTIRFTGQAPLNSLKTTGAFDSAKTLDLDDMLIVFYAAAEKLSRMKKEDAKTKLAMAESRFNRLRNSYAQRTTSIVFGGRERELKRIVPIMTVH